MNNIKMIVMDMDGTLLNSKREISEETRNALIDAEKKGIRLVLASGRSYRSLLQYGEILRMPEFGGYFIGANGAAITETATMKHEVIRQLQKEEIEEIFAAIKPYEIEAMGVLDDTIYDYIPDSLRAIKKQIRIDKNIADDVPWTAGTFSLVEDQRKNNYAHIYDIKGPEEIDKPVNKICLAHTEETLKKPYEWLMENLSDKYHFARTSMQWIECAPLGINKGNTILKLAEKLGITSDEIIVFGDGENDLTMFNAVKYPVAMGNAMERVKEAAFEITLDNDSNGISVFLKKYNLC
ncbi:Cof-type HAD-IIB family hydrolase [Anaerorhabdus sp.]|uniref:Cof-type HAD-IIB family hydrolase n=1 Tax=Anaerorhabdus sp. TaxID=1872524 RepID=UPI002FCB4535